MVSLSLQCLMSGIVSTDISDLIFAVGNIEEIKILVPSDGIKEELTKSLRVLSNSYKLELKTLIPNVLELFLPNFWRGFSRCGVATEPPCWACVARLWLEQSGAGLLLVDQSQGRGGSDSVLSGRDTGEQGCDLTQKQRQRIGRESWQLRGNSLVDKEQAQCGWQRPCVSKCASLEERLWFCAATCDLRQPWRNLQALRFCNDINDRGTFQPVGLNRNSAMEPSNILNKK